MPPPVSRSPKTRRTPSRPKAKEAVELFDEDGRSRGFYSPLNRLNDLTGKEWLYWTRSVIHRPYPPSLCFDLRSEHGGQKPPELCRDLIQVFTRAGEQVLDPFAGVGGTLLGASLCGRSAVGVELESRWGEIYREVCRREELEEQRFIVGDSRQELAQLDDGTFDLLLTDVPYWNMDRLSRSKGAFKRVGQPATKPLPSRLGRFNDRAPQSREAWLEEMAAVFGPASALLRPGGYAVVFVGDMYRDGEYHPLSFEVAGVLRDAGLTWKANLIWYDVSKKLHLYGYRYEYIPSMIHQNVLVFRKPK